MHVCHTSTIVDTTTTLDLLFSSVLFVLLQIYSCGLGHLIKIFSFIGKLAISTSLLYGNSPVHVVLKSAGLDSGEDLV